ncbi:hybrid sensor histidine kinase/response regulator transcription factor [Desertivirga brevis]|uniref:hybrid sensor histidine kinase/response regulator transcription factor n=1 Tax=Desertivirga brevis TaxID=2810310 RepID=UPI001A95ED06|nr:hybrid sensor histidine kinase/response regulator transcription factor [Pedobacter sp. SYSU D00873]
MTKRRIIIRCLGFCLLLFAFIVKAYSQDERPQFTSITVNEGLSSNTINAIVKDKYGFVWFGTDDGLNKFNGLEFTVYKNNPADKASLRNNEISCLHEDNKGRLWIGTNGGGVSLYDRKHNNFINFSSQTTGLSSNAIASLSSDNSGNLWIGTYSGLNVFNVETRKVTKMNVGPRNNASSGFSPITALYRDVKGQMWIGTPKGLYLKNRSSQTLSRFVHRTEDPSSISDDAIQAISGDSNGTVWIGTENGLNKYINSSRSFIGYFTKPNAPGSISSNFIWVLAADRNGHLWIGTEEGLDIMDVADSKVVSIKPDSRNKHSINNKSIRSILIDNQNIYWVGLFQGGVNKYDQNLSTFNLVQSNKYDPSGLNAPIVTAFAEANNENIFVGTDGGGLSEFNRKNGSFRRLKLLGKENSTILALEKSAGKLYAGTYSKGLFIIDPESGNYRQLKKGPSPSDLNHNDIFCIKADWAGNIYIGTNGGGINIYDPKSGIITKYVNDYKLERNNNYPLNNGIRAFEEDDEGHMWIGTYGGGISVFNPKTKKFRFYTNTQGGITSNVVLSLLNDHKGNMWIGTLGGGLCALNIKTNRVVSYTERNGLANNVVHKIIEDPSGFIWLSTNKGVSRFDPRTGKIKNYNRYNGLQQSSFVTGAGLEASNGEIFFGGQNGFNYFNPTHLKTNHNIPDVVFTDLKISNKSVGPADKGSKTNGDILLAEEANIDYKETFSVSFVALNFSIAEQNQYAYKLEGFDKDWNYSGTKNFATYTNLDPGEYVFKVKASNNDGLWNEKGAVLKIIIHPPFYRTKLAYFVYLVLFLSLLAYSRHRGIKRLKTKFALEQERIQARQLIEQERREAERSNELNRLKIKFLTNLSHEFRTPISLIMGPVEDLLNRQWDEKASTQLNMVKRNGRRLLNLVNQLLDFRKMEEQELKLIPAPGDIVPFLKEISESFKDLSERKKIRFNYHSNLESLHVWFDQDKVERILFNLLSNAFKFTEAGGDIFLEIDSKSYGNDRAMALLEIKVRDTGIGIAAEKKDIVFERFFQIDTDAAILNQGSGIGLSIAREFTRMHGGDILLDSEEGKGSTFTVTLPLSLAAESETAEKSPSREAELEIESLETDENTSIQTDHFISDERDLPTILLVEDNEDFRFYLKDNLKVHYRVIEATNGKEGWQKALATHPQLIVSDISMPYMDGIALSRKVKQDKRTSHIPLILLTALNAEQEQVRGLETGANDYMTKPFNFEILNAKIRNLLLLNKTLKETYTKQVKVLPTEIDIESDNEKFVNKVLRYIDENLNDPKLSVEDLSKHIGMSRATLYHKLLEVTGQSPVDFIRSVKLERAAILLEKSDYNVAQIAYMTGYSSPTYFTKSFKTKYNMLPTEYSSLKRGNRSSL